MSIQVAKHKPTWKEYLFYNYSSARVFEMDGTLSTIKYVSGEFDNVRNLRSDAKVVGKIEEQFDEYGNFKGVVYDDPIDLTPQPPKRVVLDKIGTFELVLDNETSTYSIVGKGWEVKKEMEGKPKYPVGSRVLLFGPTGTGKTHRFHATANKLKDEGKIDIIEKLTVTEGFEDTDFLAYIVPTEGGGIHYQERSIINSIRQASKGKKVALCIDELNRGSRSFMNFMLTFLDSVDEGNYVLNNTIADEKIVVPQDNLLIFATINLWGKYTWTNSMDEALKDRFQFVEFVTYNFEAEGAMINEAFWEFSGDVKKVIGLIRGLASSGEITSSISTRWVKNWSLHFMNSMREKEDVFKTFQDVLMYRLASVDGMGVPNESEILPISGKFRDCGLI